MPLLQSDRALIEAEVWRDLLSVELKAAPGKNMQLSSHQFPNSGNHSNEFQKLILKDKSTVCITRPNKDCRCWPLCVLALLYGQMSNPQKIELSLLRILEMSLMFF